MKKKYKGKLFVVRKYIYADSAADAIRKDRKSLVDDVWVDEEFKKKIEELTPAIGFFGNGHEDEDEDEDEE